MVTYRSLCLSGGGINGFIHLGCIDYLEKQKKLILLDTIVGTSIGALIGFLYCINYTPSELLDILTDLEPSHCFNLEYLDQLLEKFGIDPGEYYIAKFIDIILQKGESPLITFKELHSKYKKRLVVCGTNVSTHSAVYFGIDTTPDMKVIDAIRISTCIPFLFAPVEYNGALHVDGYLSDNYPIDYTIKDFNNRHKLDKSNVNGVIGIYINSSSVPLENNCFENYVLNMLSCLRKTSKKYKNTVYITPDVSPVNFTISKQEKLDLFQLGINSVKKYIQENNLVVEKRKSI